MRPRKKKSPPITSSPVLLRFSAPEFLPQRRGTLWHTVAGLLWGLFLVYSLLSRSWTLTVALVLLAAAFVLVRRRVPRIKEVTLTSWGIGYGKTFYDYASVSEFWIVHRLPYQSSLYLKPARRFAGLIHIELAGQDPVPLRTLLKKEIAERADSHVPFLDVLSRLIRMP